MADIRHRAHRSACGGRRRQPSYAGVSNKQNFRLRLHGGSRAFNLQEKLYHKPARNSKRFYS